MITREKLIELGLKSTNGWSWYDPQFEMMYNSKTKELFSHSEVDGDLDFICKIRDMEQLKEVVYLNFGDILNYEEA